MNLSRNDPCSCGSGLKFKKCCGKIQDAPSLISFESSLETELGRLAELFYAERYADMEQASQALLERHPELGMGWKFLGTALGVQGKPALHALQKAAQFLPDDVDVHNNLGNAFQEIGQFENAVNSYRRALVLKPDFASAQYNLGISLRNLGRLDEALDCYRKALEIKPGYTEAQTNFGKCLLDLGRPGEAMEQLRRVLDSTPNFLDANRAYLTALLYQPGMSVDASFDEHLSLSRHFHFFHSNHAPDFQNRLDSQRKLRIAYVSSDFRNHPVGRNMMPLLENRDRSQFEVWVYADVKRPDGMTEWFKNEVDEWRSIVGMSDEAAAEMIRRDKVDILCLLAGRFDGNRPMIAAYRAAPVQVSFHDPATSGLQEMDYLFTDCFLSPRDASEKFTECLIHLPTFYVHPPINEAPEISLLPARKMGHITFGSFSNPSKINEQVIALWARVLQAIPQSRLVIKYQDIFQNKSLRRRFQDQFATHGISEDCYDLVSSSDSGTQHLARYAEIDIALDTFPFTGSTTTFEALWMGVPVVTLLGDHMVARWSGAMLKKLKLEELIAQSEDEYVGIAQNLAQNPDRLAALRAGLRERVAKSPLCDEKGRARQIERAYRWMWAKWCAGASCPLN